MPINPDHGDECNGVHNGSRPRAEQCPVSADLARAGQLAQKADRRINDSEFRESEAASARRTYEKTVNAGRCWLCKTALVAGSGCLTQCSDCAEQRSLDRFAKRALTAKIKMNGPTTRR